MKGIDVEAVSSYIQAHLDEGISLKDLARAFHYSAFHLSRNFRKQTGYTIKEYIEALKIERSKEAILAEQSSLTHVAMDVGYQSPSSFSKIFKNHTLTKPSTYKSQSVEAKGFLEKWMQQKGLVKYYDKPIQTQNSLRVNVLYPQGYTPKITCVGLFRSAIPKGAPVVGYAFVGQQEIYMQNIPEGSFYLLACEIMEDVQLFQNILLKDNYRMAIQEPLHFPKANGQCIDLLMRRAIPSDPPITMNLPVMLIHNIVQKHNSG